MLVKIDSCFGRPLIKINNEIIDADFGYTGSSCYHPGTYGSNGVNTLSGVMYYGFDTLSFKFLARIYLLMTEQNAVWKPLTTC